MPYLSATIVLFAPSCFQEPRCTCLLLESYLQPFLPPIIDVRLEGHAGLNFLAIHCRRGGDRRVYVDCAYTRLKQKFKDTQMLVSSFWAVDRLVISVHNY